jgi:microcin C transport system permease protein
LGTSTRYQDPVWDMIVERLPISTFYGLVTLILTYLICVPLGILKTLRHHTLIDWFTSVVVFIGYAIPGFVVGVTLLVVFAVNMDWFPVGGFQSENAEQLSLPMRMLDIAHHAVLPLISYMAGSFAVMTLLMKNSLMENISADYVRTAIAKGVPYKSAVFKHALRNSLIPMATHFGNNISVILMGSFLIEKIFDIDGMGLLGFESVVERDYPVVLGVLVISSLLMLAGNILSDICVALVDPRVQFK